MRTYFLPYETFHQVQDKQEQTLDQWAQLQAPYQDSSKGPIILADMKRK